MPVAAAGRLRFGLVASVCLGFILVVGATGARATVVYVRSSTGAIVVARNDGSHRRIVGHGAWPAISPNGRWVAFIGGGALRLVPSRGGRSRVLLRHTYTVAVDPRTRWSIDSRYLIAGDPDPATAIFDVRTGQRRLIRLPSSDYGGGTISPDDRLALFVSVRSGGGGGGGQAQTTIFAVSLRPAGRPAVAVSNSFEPVWGRHGFVYSGPRGLDFKRRLDQRKPRRLGVGGDPIVWSRNGWRLLTQQFAGGIGPVFLYHALVIDLRNGRRELLPGPFTAVDGLARDGRAVLAEQDGDVVVQSPDGATSVVATGAFEATWTG